MSGLTGTTDSTDARLPAGLAAVGAAATTALLVAVPLIELLATEFSALVALPLGLLAGLATLVGVAFNFGDLHPVRRRALLAYAAFGPAVVLVLLLAYVNVGRDLFTVEVAVGVGLAATAAVYVGLGLSERDSG
ncbi:hypothetical protein [Haloarcula laminariae]|uniref:hypothetical protein n=1 Tax=Haloarcula laminariae TaxID=2961577 RepID=UPI002406F86E|nr:hypothetical protein [Halomicroarcula sp. FL173]